MLESFKDSAPRQMSASSRDISRRHRQSPATRHRALAYPSTTTPHRTPSAFGGSAFEHLGAAGGGAPEQTAPRSPPPCHRAVIGREHDRPASAVRRRPHVHPPRRSTPSPANAPGRTSRRPDRFRRAGHHVRQAVPIIMAPRRRTRPPSSQQPRPPRRIRGWSRRSPPRPRSLSRGSLSPSSSPRARVPARGVTPSHGPAAQAAAAARGAPLLMSEGPRLRNRTGGTFSVPLP